MAHLVTTIRPSPSGGARGAPQAAAKPESGAHAGSSPPHRRILAGGEPPTSESNFPYVVCVPLSMNRSVRSAACAAFVDLGSSWPRCEKRRTIQARVALLWNSGLDWSESMVFSSREDQEVSYGLNWAIAVRGVVVKDKVFYNLEPAELQKGGTTYAERLSGIPLHVKGNVIGGFPDVSGSQFAKLLKQVTFHLSSISSLYVQDGAIGSSAAAEFDVKVRIISDNPSAIMSLSNVLQKVSDRAVSHDTCPLTIYVASSISTNVRNALGSGTQYANGVAAADIERSSLILCGKAFSDSSMLKDALTALAAPISSARGGLPVPGW
ncbi:hypothetical protein ACQ4PT_008171 [Festuca glaucescens]